MPERLFEMSKKTITGNKNISYLYLPFVFLILICSGCSDCLLDERKESECVTKETNKPVVRRGIDKAAANERPADVSLVKKYFPVYKFSAGERWYPCSFYFNKNSDTAPVWPDELYNRADYDSYCDSHGGAPSYYAFVHIAEDDEYKAIQYWLYYVWNHHWLNFLPFTDSDHHSDWDSTVFVVLKKGIGELKPEEIYYFFHQYKKRLSWDNWPQKQDDTHPVIYVAKNSHGAYPEPGRFECFDEWKDNGKVLEEKDFNWYLVAGFTGYGLDKNRFCRMKINWLQGQPQWEFGNDYWWPREFPENKNSYMDAPWHRVHWNLTRPR